MIGQYDYLPFILLVELNRNYLPVARGNHQELLTLPFSKRTRQKSSAWSWLLKVKRQWNLLSFQLWLYSNLMERNMNRHILKRQGVPAGIVILVSVLEAWLRVWQLYGRGMEWPHMLPHWIWLAGISLVEKGYICKCRLNEVAMYGHLADLAGRVL